MKTKSLTPAANSGRSRFPPLRAFTEARSSYWLNEEVDGRGKYQTGTRRTAPDLW